MKKEEIKKLKNGLYKIKWDTGGFSVAAIGMLSNGDKWLAPTNWVEPTTKQNFWRHIDSVELIRTQKETK